MRALLIKLLGGDKALKKAEAKGYLAGVIQAQGICMGTLIGAMCMCRSTTKIGLHQMMCPVVIEGRINSMMRGLRRKAEQSI